jgi:hypothetical protein
MTLSLLKFRIAPNLILVGLLIGAQIGAAVHAFEHDLSAAQTKVCSTCITAAQLGTGAIASPMICELTAQHYEKLCSDEFTFRSTSTVAVRQRGPPAIS